MIKKILLASSLMVALSFPAFAGCAQEEQNIRRQLDYARSYGNTNRVAGLEKALANTKTYCGTDSQNKVIEKQRELSNRELQLQQARESGRTKKINKAIKKRDKAQAKVAKAQRRFAN